MSAKLSALGGTHSGPSAVRKVITPTTFFLILTPWSLTPTTFFLITTTFSLILTRIRTLELGAPSADVSSVPALRGQVSGGQGTTVPGWKRGRERERIT